MEHQPFPRRAPGSLAIRSGAILDFVEVADRDMHHLHSHMLPRRGGVVQGPP